jgi:hypothetical protein
LNSYQQQQQQQPKRPEVKKHQQPDVLSKLASNALIV